MERFCGVGQNNMWRRIRSKFQLHMFEADIRAQRSIGKVGLFCSLRCAIYERLVSFPGVTACCWFYPGFGPRVR